MGRTVLLVLRVTGADASSKVHGGTALDIELDL